MYFLDEAVFTETLQMLASGYPKPEDYYRQDSNSFQCMAVVAGIKVSGEVVAMQMEEGSIKIEPFIRFIKGLFRIYKGLPFNIYFFNLSFHKIPGVRQNVKTFIVNSYSLIFSPAY